MVIQTRNPNHWIVQLVIENNIERFMELELLERMNFRYPPYFKLIHVNLRHSDENLVIQASKALAEALKQKLNERILGPEFPMIKRIQGMYQQEIKIKFEKTLSDKKMKEYLLALLDQFYKNVRYKKIKINVDVDPY
ncbi:MAG: hypothetical protein EBV19_10860 [Flavobacteriia bacterium]|nr:hypothetical protein [Flavobacteriia bacterium]